MGTTINARMQQRSDTAENWSLINPVLRVGELGHEQDTGEYKAGDGVTAWLDLPYVLGGLSDAVQDAWDARDEAEGFAAAAEAVGATHDAQTAANITSGAATQAAGDARWASRTSRAEHVPAFGLYFPEAEGAAANGTTDDSTPLANAMTAAAAVGGTVVMPALLRIDSTLTPPANVTIAGAHRSRSKVIYGGTYGQMAFDLLNPGAVVRDLHIEQTGTDIVTRGSSGVSGRAIGSDGLASGVFIAANDCSVRNIQVTNFHNAVRLDNYNLDGLGTNTVYATDTEVVGLTVKDCHFGLIGRGHDRVFVDRIEGNYVNAVAEPPHLIYFSGQTPGLSCKNVQVGTARAWNGQGNAAFKFAGITGGQVGELYANGCSGVLEIAACTDFVIDSVVSKGDAVISGRYSIVMDSSQDTRIVSAVLQIVGLGGSIGRGVNLGNTGTDCDIDMLTVDYRAATGGTGVRFNGGTRYRVGTLKVIGDSVNTAAILAAAGQDCSVGALETVNCTSLLSVTGGDGLTVRYDPTLQLGTFLSDRLVSLTGGTNTRVVRHGGMKQIDVLTVGTVQVDVCKAETIVYRVTTTTSSTRPTPRDGTRGQRVTLVVWNDSGGTMSSFNWADWNVATGWTNPTAGQKIAITFQHDGTRFSEIYRGGSVAA